MADTTDTAQGAATSEIATSANDQAPNPSLPPGEPEPVEHKRHATDSMAQRMAQKADKAHEKKAQLTNKSDDEKKGPKGGFDDTPVPRALPGWTVRITFHRANNLPAADINSLSSDPYILSQINHKLPTRHKQDPPIRMRTPTIRRDTNPVWNCDWVLCNVPASGFEMKCRVYDEDPADHDDRLGNVHVHVSNIKEGWPGIKEQSFTLKKRMASKRAYLLRGCATLFDRSIKMSGELVISVQLLGRTQDRHGGRIYTLGPCAWTQHFSPMIGRLVGIKDPGNHKAKNGEEKEQQRYNFQANQMQLRGPVPEELYHRYVEFRPIIAGMFETKSLRGRLLNRALHHQHARIYSFDRTTVYGSFPEPCLEMTKQFLDLVHYNEGGRIFTYVLTLDAHWRFTETGSEFSVDLLSKHTMHSDVSIYIAFSGEFFIRRLRNGPGGDSSAGPSSPVSGDKLEDDTTIPEKSKHRHRVGQYELIIDNDSGTYRPNQDTLPLLKQFFERNLPGLNITTLSCVDDEEKMQKMKAEQRQRKKEEGQTIAMAQVDDNSSVSSSDEEGLDNAAGVHRERSRRQKLWHQVSEPKATVLAWAQKNHSDDENEKNEPHAKHVGEDNQQPKNEAAATQSRVTKHEEKREEKHEEKEARNIEAAEEKTGFAEGNKQEGTAENVDLSGPGLKAHDEGVNGTAQQAST